MNAEIPKMRIVDLDSGIDRTLSTEVIFGVFNTKISIPGHAIHYIAESSGVSVKLVHSISCHAEWPSSC